jgi:hypothetical protein
MTTALEEAKGDIEIAFRQLEFSIKLLSYCEAGGINPRDFDTDHLVQLSNGNLHFPTGHFSDPDNIRKAAGTSVLIAFSASILVLDKAFEVGGIAPNPESADAAVRLRTLVYMLRCAQAHGIADPRWEVRGKFRRTIAVDLESAPISIDLTAMDGRPFNVDDIGGYENWCRIRDTAMQTLFE